MNKLWVIILVLFLAVLVLIYQVIKVESGQKQTNQAVSVSKSDIKNCEKQVSQTRCWEILIKTALNQKGLPAAFDVLTQLYAMEPAFATDCHGFTHQLGEAAYYLFDQGKSVALNGKTSYCGFGFYHGFMETLLDNGGKLQEARDFCAYVGKTLADQTANAENACYHGIGHGAVDGIDPKTWGSAQAMIAVSLDTCKKVATTDRFLNECASGTFNSLAILYGEPKYKLTLNQSDPFRICQQQAAADFKRPCYEEMNTLIMRLGNNDFNQAAIFLKTIKEASYAPSATASLAGYAAHFIPENKTDNSDMIESCRRLLSNLQTACITGFVGGLIEFGSPDVEYVNAIIFCQAKTLNEEQRKACFDRVLWLASVYYPADKFQMVCDKVEEKYRVYCSR